MQESTGAPLSAGADPDGTPAATPRPGVLRWCAVSGTLTLLVDQATKVWALQGLDDGRVIPLVGDLLSLRLVFNSGAAFSIGASMTWLMTLVALAVTLAILVVLPRVRSRYWALALGLLLGGSVGNLIDRFFREPGPLRGHVIDFIDYGGLFVGNLADIAIVAAAGVLLWLVFRGVGMDGSRDRQETGPETSDRGEGDDG